MLADVVRAFVGRLPEPRSLIAAVSGGPDSVALARALADAAPGRVVLAHLNHQLRGSDSDDDEQFVRELAHSLTLEMRSDRIDVRQQTEFRRANLEQTARDIRYLWLSRIATDMGIPYVATGHTADDQAETVLHRILRGTSLRGLRGIAENRRLTASARLVRPLLRVRRASVLAYLAELRQSFRHDASNDDPAHMRNRLRHDLLPMLQRDYNPRVVDALNHLADHARIAHEFVAAEARALLAAVELPRAGATVVLDHAPLEEADPAITREMLHLLWEREEWPLGAMGFAEWERILQVVTRRAQAIDLPGEIRVRRRASVLQISRVRGRSTASSETPGTVNWAEDP